MAADRAALILSSMDSPLALAGAAALSLGAATPPLEAAEGRPGDAASSILTQHKQHPYISMGTCMAAMGRRVPGAAARTNHLQPSKRPQTMRL